MRWLMVLLIGLLPGMLVAKTLEGVNLPEQVNVGDTTLVLNGAGIREKFFFDIYIAALYLPAKSSNAKQILEADKPWRLSMDFLYSEVEREKLDKGWEEGIEENVSAADRKAIRERLDKFKTLFSTMHKGDSAVLDYVPGKGLSVTVKGETKGVIPGADFARSMLSIWLGSEPVTGSLKKALLRGS